MLRSRVRSCAHRQATSDRKYKSWARTFVIKSFAFNYPNPHSISSNRLIDLHAFKFHLISHDAGGRSLMCAWLKKVGEKEYCHGQRRIPPITRIRRDFPWKSPRGEFGETLFSSDKLCRATAPDGRAHRAFAPHVAPAACANIRFLRGPGFN